jgi:hypothetical protein
MAKLKPKKGPSKGKPTPRHGEDFLSGLEAVTIKLENGTVVTINVEDELCVPEGTIALEHEARLSPSRFAFWAYQAERVLGKLRAEEVKLAHQTGEVWLTHKEYYRTETDDRFIAKETLQAHVDISTDVRSIQIKVDKLRKQYGILRAIRDAVEHRDFVIRRLLGKETEAKQGT